MHLKITIIIIITIKNNLHVAFFPFLCFSHNNVIDINFIDINHIEAYALHNVDYVTPIIVLMMILLFYVSFSIKKYV